MFGLFFFFFYLCVVVCSKLMGLNELIQKLNCFDDCSVERFNIIGEGLLIRSQMTGWMNNAVTDCDCRRHYHYSTISSVYIYSMCVWPFRNHSNFLLGCYLSAYWNAVMRSAIVSLKSIHLGTLFCVFFFCQFIIVCCFIWDQIKRKQTNKSLLRRARMENRYGVVLY